MKEMKRRDWEQVDRKNRKWGMTMEYEKKIGVGLHLSSMKWNIQNSIRKGKQDKGVQKYWIVLNQQIS